MRDMDDQPIMRPDAIRPTVDSAARIEGRRHVLFAAILLGSIALMAALFACAQAAMIGAGS